MSLIAIGEHTKKHVVTILKIFNSEYSAIPIEITQRILVEAGYILPRVPMDLEFVRNKEILNTYALANDDPTYITPSEGLIETAIIQSSVNVFKSLYDKEDESIDMMWIVKIVSARRSSETKIDILKICIENVVSHANDCLISLSPSEVYSFKRLLDASNKLTVCKIFSRAVRNNIFDTNSYREMSRCIDRMLGNTLDSSNHTVVRIELPASLKFLEFPLFLTSCVPIFNIDIYCQHRNVFAKYSKEYYKWLVVYARLNDSCSLIDIETCIRSIVDDTGGQYLAVSRAIVVSLELQHLECFDALIKYFIRDCSITRLITDHVLKSHPEFTEQYVDLLSKIFNEIALKETISPGV